MLFSKSIPVLYLTLKRTDFFYKKLQPLTMKKYFCALILITAFCGMAHAQTKKINLLEKDFGGLYLSYIKITDQVNTSYMLTMSFKSTENSTAVGIKTITLNSDDGCRQFTKDLSNAVTQMDANEDVDMSWDRKTYSLEVMEGQKGVYLYNENKVGHIFLNKKNSDKLLYLMNRISFGSDEINP